MEQTYIKKRAYIFSSSLVMKYICIKLIKLYQRFISPLLGNRCRFYPTCSQYALDAISKYGVLKGVFISFKRIMRCHPFNKGGYDPVS